MQDLLTALAIHIHTHTYIHGSSGRTAQDTDFEYKTPRTFHSFNPRSSISTHTLSESIEQHTLIKNHMVIHHHVTQTNPPTYTSESSSIPTVWNGKSWRLRWSWAISTEGWLAMTMIRFPSYTSRHWSASADFPAYLDPGWGTLRLFLLLLSSIVRLVFGETSSEDSCWKI